MNILDMIETDVKKEFDESNKVTLKEFTIKNYRSITEHYSVVGNNGIVFMGENGTGKTSRIEALLWLLTGTLFDGSVNGLQQYIMPKNANRDTVVDVTATFEVGSETFIFTKQLSEKWVKKRGGDEEVNEGVVLTYYVNGVEKNKVSEFNDMIYRVFGLKEASQLISDKTQLLKKINLMLLFLNLDFFLTLDNKTLRELVLLVGGDVNVKDLTMSDKLREVLVSKSYEVDDVKKIIKMKLQGDKNNEGLNDTIKRLKQDVELTNKSIEGIETIKTIEEAQNQVQTLEQAIIDLRVELQKGEEDVKRDYEIAISKLEKQLSEEMQQLNKKDTTDEVAFAKISGKLLEVRSEYSNIKGKMSEFDMKNRLCEQTINSKEAQINTFKIRGKSLVEHKKHLEASSGVTCPQCGHMFILNNQGQELQKTILEMKELRSKITQAETDIKELVNEQISIKGEVDKLQIEMDKNVEIGVAVKGEVEALAETIRLSTLNASSQGFESEVIQSIKSKIQRLRNEQNEAILDFVIRQQRLKTDLNNTQVELEKVKATASKGQLYANAVSKIKTLQTEIAQKQRDVNSLEQLEMELKILEEQYLLAIDEKLKNAFGENIRFVMFETNASNENLTPICEMLVKDSFGRWVSAINGINTGHSVPRLVEFLTIVKRSLGIRDGLLLIDFLESVGNEPLQQLISYGQQIVGTQVVRNQTELKVENL